MITFKPLTEGHEFMWLKNRAGAVLAEDMVGIVAYRDGEIQAVCIADNWNGVSCQVHFAIDNPMVIRAGFFTKIADYVFLQRGAQRMFGIVAENNEKALRLDRKIGFKEVARVPRGTSEEIDTVIMSMHRDECRWTSNESGAALVAEWSSVAPREPDQVPRSASSPSKQEAA